MFLFERILDETIEKTKSVYVELKKDIAYDIKHLDDVSIEKRVQIIRDFVIQIAQSVSSTDLQISQAIQNPDNYMFRAFVRRSDGKRYFKDDPEHPYFNSKVGVAKDSTLKTTLSNIKDYGSDLPPNAAGTCPIDVSVGDPAYSMQEFFVGNVFSDQDIIEEFGKTDLSFLLIYKKPEDLIYKSGDQIIYNETTEKLNDLLHKVLIIKWVD